MSALRDRAVLAGFLASLAGVLVTPWCARDRVPELTPWVECVRAQASALQRGTVVLVHPPWRDDVVAAVKRAGVLPAGVSVTAALAPRQTDPLPPIVVIRERGGVPLPRALRDTELLAQWGPLVVERVRSTPVASGARDLLDDLASARVEVALPDRTIACAWDAARQRHTCPDLPEWMYVGAERLPVGGTRQRCAWAHPITGGAVTIELPGALVHGTVELALALTDTAADNRAGAPVTAILMAEDRELARVTRQGVRGFASARAEVPATADRVRVVMTTPHDGQRHACFRLTSARGP